MSLRVYLQLLTPVWNNLSNLSMFRVHTTCVWLFVLTGQYLVQRKRKRQYLVRRKWKQKRKRKRKTGMEPSIYVNLRDFGLSTRICLFVCVIFSVCLSVYFLDIWRFLYLPTHSCDGMMACQFVLPSSSVLVRPLKPASSL